MNRKEADFLEVLRATFRVEAGEHVHAIATGLLELEKTPAPDAQRRLLETIFRAAHSLKGAARAVDFTDIESLCQSLEERFAAWKRQPHAPPPGILDAAHRTLDDISAAMALPRAAPAPAAASEPPAPQFLVTSAPVDKVSTDPARQEKGIAADETVRIAVAKLDAHVLDAEEMLAAKLTSGQRAVDLRTLATRFDAWRKAWTAVEPEARALRESPDPSAPGMGRVLAFLDWNLESLNALERQVAGLARTADQDRQTIGKLVDDLLHDSKQLLVLPFAALTAPFHKLVRDLCRDQGKEADLIVRGEEVEIDKRILEELKAPLIHLLRNAVDHGIEMPDARRRLSKPSRGTITLAASRVNGNKVEVRMSDDGGGIDTDRVKASAVEHAVLSPNEASRLDEGMARRLIFEPEVSTSPIITRVSGRGLGLAIVREKADKLGGTVSVWSQPGEGTQFSIVLSSTLATFRGILVQAAEGVFVVPTFQVERVARVLTDEIGSVEGRDTVSLNGRAVALVRLADVLELPPAASNSGPHAVTTVLVLGAGEHRTAFAVDAVIDEQEVLVKPLGKLLSRVRNVAGATVLGSGRVAPILNAADLLKSAKKIGGAVARAPSRARETPDEQKSVLVVEDSITSRMLLKSILESAGYRVDTAVDGVEAFTLLRAERFDLVVSDVEMPRLNGFDLTAKIRADRKLAELPVVLVTALETREDRERGIDVGASAYIVKSKFDQSNLLDAVRRLV